MTVRTAEKREQVKRAIRALMANEPYGWALPSYAVLCASQRVSAGTVSDALDELIEEEALTKRGMVYLKGAPSDIARVATLAIGRHSVGDLMGLRLCLETGAAELAAKKIGVGHGTWRPCLERLLRKIEEMSNTTRIGVLEALDWEVHDAILRATENKAVCELGSKLHIVLEGCVKTNVRAMGHDAEYRQATHAQHKRILTAIVNGSATLAVAAIKEHLDYAMWRMGQRRLAQPASLAGA